MSIIVLLFMILLHTVEDFHLQGIMAQMKQKSWWREQTADRKYRNDYIVALVLHGFGWSMCIHTPLMLYWLLTGFSIGAIECYLVSSIIVMGLIHSYIDDMKANKLRINLVQDQLLHIIQIIIVFIVFIQ